MPGIFAQVVIAFKECMVPQFLHNNNYVILMTQKFVPMTDNVDLSN